MNIESKKQRNKKEESKMKTLSRINTDAHKIIKLAKTKISWKEAFNLACEIEDLDLCIYNYHLQQFSSFGKALSIAYSIVGDEGRSIAFNRARAIALECYDLTDFFNQKYISSSIRKETLIFFSSSSSERVRVLQDEVSKVNPYFDILNFTRDLNRFTPTSKTITFQMKKAIRKNY